MPLNRDQVTPPVLPEEIVPFPPADGDVIVRGLLMTQRLANDRIHAEERKPLEGESEVQAQSRAGARIVTRLLAQAVVDDDGRPLFSEREWDVYGADPKARGDVFRVFNVAMRLSGHDLDVIEKN
jgi:hypothetical protein